MGAEGNPLYLEELLNAFVEGKGERHSRTITPAYTSARLTPTLESLLLARIDRLPTEPRRLVQIAAVIGRSFPERVLEHVAHTEDLGGPARHPPPRPTSSVSCGATPSPSTSSGTASCASPAWPRCPPRGGGSSTARSRPHSRRCSPAHWTTI